MSEHLLENSTLFKGLSASDVRAILEETPHHVQCYDKGETIFHLMDEAARIGSFWKAASRRRNPLQTGARSTSPPACPVRCLDRLQRSPRTMFIPAMSSRCSLRPS